MTPKRLLFLLTIFGVAASLAACDAGGLRAQAKAAGEPFITPANALERAVVAFADHPTPEGEAEIGRQLLQSTVYLSVDARTAASWAEGRRDMPLNLWNVTLPDGRGALAIYTGRDRLAKAFRETDRHDYIAIDGLSALRLAGDGKPVAINWGVSPHIYWGPEQTIRLLRSKAPVPTSIHRT